MRSVISALTLFVLAAALGGWTWLGSQPRPLVVDTAGHEEASDGGLLVNGWAVENRGAAVIRDAYERYQGFLGEPVSGFDGVTQSFRMGRLRYAPGNGADWQLEFDNLGYLDMQVEGYTPNPGRTPHPAVRDWIQSQLEVGIDAPRLIGRIISDPICDGKAGVCTQWTDKQRFTFSMTATSGDEVRRQPLGLWFVHPPARPTGSTLEVMNVAPLVLAVMAVLGGLVLLLGRRPGYLGPSRAQV